MNTNRLIHLAKRAASASPQELQTRLKQAAFVVRNHMAAKRGGSAFSPHAHLRSLKLQSTDLAEWWSNRDSKWKLTDKTIENLANNETREESRIPWVIEQADLVVSGRMPLFSYEPIDFTRADRWHRDAILSRTAPRKFYGSIRYLDVDCVGDSKHVWEPNRFAWSIWLGVAWRITKDDRYLAKFFELAEDWFEQNPYPTGINYCSALEVAFRNHAWLWCLELFSEPLAADRPALLEDLLAGIWIGCEHLRRSLSTYFAPNTHIIGEGFGLFACGAALPEFEEAEEWRELGLNILAEEAKKQFHHDGTHRELSTGYHLYSTDFYTQALLIGQKTGFELPSTLVEATRRMLIRLSEFATLDQYVPQMNDCDGGRVMSLVPGPLDAGPTLMAGEYLFDDLSLVVGDRARRGYCLLTCVDGGKSTTPRVRVGMPLDRELHRLYDSGLVTYKTWDGDYVAFRSTPFGYHDCPHSHDAGLGLVLYLNGIPVFLDTGVGSYTQSAECRNEFRGAAGKNTILVDGNGPSVPEGWFSWASKTDCELVSLKRFADGFSARGVHSGFSRGDRFVSIQREITMLDIGILAVVDRWDANSEVSVESRFTLHPDLLLDPGMRSLEHPDQVVYFSASVLDGGEDPEIFDNECSYSPNYGQILSTRTLGFRAPRARRGGLITVFSRVGSIEKTRDAFTFQDLETAIHLAMTHDGVEPRQTELIRTAVDAAVTGRAKHIK